MKKNILYPVLLTAFVLFSLQNVFSQSIIPLSDELILPQIAMTGNTTATRLQYVCRLKLSGLIPNATYRYYSSASTSSTITTSNAPGNFFAISNTSIGNAGYILGYSSGKGLNGSQMGVSPNENEFTSANRYDVFATDALGTYTGWFSVVPTSNAVFAPGNNIYFYVQLNNGAGGTTIATSYRTTSTIHVVDLGTTSGNANQATAIRGTSNVAAENMIFLYDNTAGTGRPLSGTWTENDGITTNFTTWYGSVEGINSSWGAVIPNNLPAGIQRIEARNVTNGTLLGCPSIDADGIWPGGANTINPAGGTTPIVITLSDAPMQFIASSNSPVCTGSTINFSSTNGTAYNWSGPASFTSSSATPFITNASNSNAGTYTVQITDANGCTSPASTTVAVNNSVNATVSGGGTICQGDSALITFTLSGAGPWDFVYSDGSNSASVSAQATSPYTFYAHTSGVYTVTSITTSGCSGTGIGNATVIVSTPSAPTINPSSPTIYSYNAITLTASGTGIFNWYTSASGGSPIFTGASFTPNPSLTSTTTYYASATSSSCTSSRTPVTVTVIPNPVSMSVYNYWHPYTLGNYHNFNILFGGFSGLNSVPGNPNEFYTVTDRGPNLDANNNVHANGNPNAKLFPLPNFSPSIVHFTLQGDSINVLAVTPIKRPNNTNTSGLILPPNAGGTGELAFIDTSGATGTPDIWGIDSEGLTSGNDNDFWMCEEYGTSVWHVDSTGKVINRYTPWALSSGGQPQDLPIDSVFKYRNPNKGFEGVAYAPNGKVYAGIQNMIFFPASASSAIKSNSRLHRIEEIDPATGITKMYGYEHDPVPTSPAYGSTINNGNRYIGDAVAVNDHQFLILEHGKSSSETYAKVYMIDIASATPITQALYSGLSFEQLYTASNALSHGITCVTKTLVVDLIACGYDGNLDKEEGIALVNDSTIAITNDNDFGVISPAADGNVSANGIPTRVYVFHLNQHLALCRNAYITASSSTTFCAGNSVALNASTGTGFTYQWNLNGSSIPGATSATYAANSSGNYSVQVTNPAGCLAISAMKNVNVLPLPSATITASGSTTFCQGGTVTLAADTGSGLTYQWQLNNTPISGANQFSYIANASGNYNVVVTNSNSCTATSNQNVVTVNLLPVAAITSGGPLTFCQGGNVLLSANSGSGLIYQWKLNIVNISGANQINYTANASGNYSVIVTNGSGCSATSAIVNVNVNPLPNATITAGGPTSFCAGNTVSLNATTGSGFTYQWMLNNSAISGANASSYIANTSGNYQATITNGNGCSATSAITALNIFATPIVSITPANATFCQGDSVMFSANTVNGYTYQWLLNGNAINGATASTFIATSAGNYSYTAITVMGCSATSSISSVTVNPLPPVPVITQNGNILSADPGYTYQWYLNGNPLSGATSQTYNVTATGFYSVEINDGNNCSSLSTSVYMGPTTISSVDPSAAILAVVYPNPFNEAATIDLQLPADMNVRIEIDNLLGEKVYETRGEKINAGLTHISIDKTMFNGAGTYFIKISCGNSMLTKKIVLL